MRFSRHLNSQVAQTSLAILLVLLLIFISQQFVRFLSDVVDSKIAPEILFGMVALQVPPLAGFLVPLALYLGVLVAFGQLYVDNELTVARSFGLGDKALLKMLVPVSVLSAIIAGAITLYLTPWAATTQQHLLDQQDKRSELALLSPGKFQPTQDGKSVFYAAKSSASQNLEQFFFFSKPTPVSPYWHLITAQNVTIEGGQSNTPTLKLITGKTYRFSSENLSLIDSSFGEYSMPILAELAVDRKPKLRSVASIDLLASKQPEALAEFHWRLSVPISVLILVFLAVPIARVQPRQGKFAKLFPALLLYLSYVVLLLLNKGFIEDEKIPVGAGLWMIHAVFFTLALLQYRHSHRHVSKRRIRFTPPTKQA